MELIRFDASRYSFPAPRVPLLPHRLAWSGNRRCCLTSSASSISSGFRYFTKGRYALREAYRLVGLGRDSSLLAPAYHCVTMLDPAVSLEANVELYPLHQNLSPNLTELKGRLQSASKPVKAVLATHFFGLVQDFSALKELCDEHGVALIEDCSHVIFTEDFRSHGAGLYGQFVTASPYKFFACEDGGLLYAVEPHLLADTVLKSPGFWDELRGIKRMAEKARLATRVPTSVFSSPEQLPGPIERKLDGHFAEIRLPYDQPSRHFSAEDIAKSSLRLSRYLVRASNIEELSFRRRQNFNRWTEAVSELPHCQMLFSNLPADCTPYMFPLRISHPEWHFQRLKFLGLPIWRWDEMAFSDCDVAQDYRLHLLHLPVHQSLSDAQMDWMIAVLRETMLGESGGGR